MRGLLIKNLALDEAEGQVGALQVTRPTQPHRLARLTANSFKKLPKAE